MPPACGCSVDRDVAGYICEFLALHLFRHQAPHPYREKYFLDISTAFFPEILPHIFMHTVLVIDRNTFKLA